MIEIGPLLAPAAELPPGGPDLEYDPSFLELDQRARGRDERRIGDTVVAGEPPPWAEVETSAAALLQRSKDLRVACILTRAMLHLDGLAGLLQGLRLLHGLLERYWDAVYPRLDADDGHDPTMRMNALAPLADPLVMLRELRDTAIVRSRQHGVVLVRDVEVALNRLPARDGSASPTQAQIGAILAAALGDDSESVPPAAAALEAAHGLAALLDTKVGADRAPDLKPLLGVLGAIVQVVCAPAPAAAPAEPSAAAETAVAAAPAGHTAAPAPGAIRSRQEALMMIDRIIQFLEGSEPTNPAPLLLRRSKRFMTMSFVDIVREIAPESIEKIDVIAGPRDAE